MPPRAGQDRAKIYREWGILLRDSGLPNALGEAQQKLELSLKDNPKDVVTITVLAQIYGRRAAYARIIELCEPWKDRIYGKTKELMLTELARAYDQEREWVKASETRDLIKKR